MLVDKVFKYDSLFHVLHVNSVSFVVYIVYSRSAYAQTSTFTQHPTLKCMVYSCMVYFCKLTTIRLKISDSNGEYSSRNQEML